MAIIFPGGTQTGPATIIKIASTDTNAAVTTTGTTNTWQQINSFNTSFSVSDTNNQVLIIISIGLYGGGGGVGTAWAATANGARIKLGTPEGNRIATGFQAYVSHQSHGYSTQWTTVYTPGTSNAITYGVQFRAQNGTTTTLGRTLVNDNVNDTYSGRANSSLTLMEISV
jgi:hypothetical protein